MKFAYIVSERLVKYLGTKKILPYDKLNGLYRYKSTPAFNETIYGYYIKNN